MSQWMAHLGSKSVRDKLHMVPFQSRENLIALRSRCNLLESRLHISGVFRCTLTHISIGTRRHR